MRYLFLLSGQNTRLALEEAKALFSAGKMEEHSSGILLVNENSRTVKRYGPMLGYTKAVHQVLFESTIHDLPSSIRTYNWKPISKGTFCVRVSEISGKAAISEKEIASLLWKKISSPKVDLSHPDHQLVFFFLKKRVFATRLLFTIDRDVRHRMPHLWPKPHPTSLHPLLARAFINLTGIRRGTLTDPFCGSGGILIEAGLMGLSPRGYDIDKEMLEKARINLQKFHLNADLIQKDARALNSPASNIVSDLPYGRNTRHVQLSLLCNSFLLCLRKILRHRAVLSFPLFPGKNLDYQRILHENGFRILFRFNHYLHKTLSKEVFVLEPYSDSNS